MSRGAMGRFLAAAAVILCLATAALPAAAKKKQKKSDPAAVALFKKALAVSDIEAKGSPAFRLQATVRFFGAHHKQAEAMLVQFWIPGGKWREETMAPGFNFVEVSDGRNQWAKGTLDYEPFPVYEAWAALDFSRRLRQQLGLESKAPPSWPERMPNAGPSKHAAPKPYLARPKQKKHSEECVEDKSDSSLRGQSCFDATTGDLVSEADRDTGIQYEYADFAAFGEERFPRVASVFYEGGNKMLEIHVIRLDPLPQPSPATFLPLKGSQVEFTPACAKTTKGKLVKKALPVYPPASKDARVQGTVVLYAYIGPDGIPRGLWPMKSPGPSLTYASLNAVRQWRYEPLSCKSAGVSRTAFTTTFITVVYTLGQ